MEHQKLWIRWRRITSEDALRLYVAGSSATINRHLSYSTNRLMGTYGFSKLLVIQIEKFVPSV
jgi:hypothetical protein